jgi:cytochrome c-type biogenesis protein CcmH/NrfF
MRFSPLFSKLRCHPERSEGSAVVPSKDRTTLWLKTAQALALAVAVCFTLGATDAGTRYNDLNHRLMCTCSCAEILGECNHVGCPSSAGELDELRAGIEAGKSDKQIFDSFSAKYGAVVLAAPTTEGFNLVAWIAPFAVFAAALLGTILLVRHWSVGKTELAAQPANAEMDAIRDRIRRETGEEGGY